MIDPVPVVEDRAALRLPVPLLQDVKALRVRNGTYSTDTGWGLGGRLDNGQAKPVFDWFSSAGTAA